MIERFKKLGYVVERDIPNMRYFISNGKKTTIITDSMIYIIGKPMRDYHHKRDCMYHEDNWDDYSWRLPDPPNCDCPYDDLPPYTEDDIFDMIIQTFHNS